MGKNEAARPIFPGKNPKTQRDSQPDRLLVVATRVGKCFGMWLSIVFFRDLHFFSFNPKNLTRRGQHLPPGGP